MHTDDLAILLKFGIWFSRLRVGPESCILISSYGLQLCWSQAPTLSGKIIRSCVIPARFLKREGKCRGSMKMDFMDFLILCSHLHAQIWLTFFFFKTTREYMVYPSKNVKHNANARWTLLWVTLSFVSKSNTSFINSWTTNLISSLLSVNK